MNAFASRLDKMWASQPFKYDIDSLPLFIKRTYEDLIKEVYKGLKSEEDL